MAGTITATTIQNDTSSPPTFRNNSVEIGTLCRAWVNFNGTGTVAIRGSFNVSSITDNGTGNYTVNFTTAISDANYAVTSINASVDPAGGIIAVSQSSTVTQTTSAFKLIYQNYAGTVFDIPYCVATVFR
jgi:hypothetical protein